MSIEAYKIAIKIALTENVTRGLVMMAGHFKSANTSAEALEKRLATIGKMTLWGGGLVAAGSAGLKMLDEPLKKAMEYERYVAQMRQMGLGDNQISEAKKFVEATNVINTSMLDRMKVFTEAQGAFRESGKTGSEALHAAKEMMPILATYEVAMSTLSGSKYAAAEGAMRNLNKTVEIMGGLGDTNRAKAIADGVFKAVQSSGKMVDERQLKQFVAFGGSATNSIDQRAIFGGLEPIIGEYGGSRVGVALRTAFNRMSGAMALPPKLMQSSLENLGIGKTENGKTRLNDQMLKTMQTNPIEFANKMMQTYEAHGIKSVLDRERMNSILFSPSSANIYNKLMSQMSTIQESLKSYDNAKGISETVNDPANKPLMSQQDLAKKFEDFELALAMNGGLLDMATKGLTMLASAVSGITSLVKEYPILAKFIVGGLALASVIAVVGGGVLMLSAAFMALVTFSPIALIAKTIYGVTYALGFLVGRVQVISLAIRSFGVMMMANPIGLAILGVIAVGLLLWNNWKEISGAFFTMLGLLKSGFIKLFHGDLLGAWYAFSGYFLKGFQTLLNTLIAGINKILPAAMALQKLDFADKYNSLHNASAPATGKPGAPVPGTLPPSVALRQQQQPIQLKTAIQLNGRTFYEEVTEWMHKEASRPSTGAPTYDPSMGPVPVGLN